MDTCDMYVENLLKKQALSGICQLITLFGEVFSQSLDMKWKSSLEIEIFFFG